MKSKTATLNKPATDSGLRAAISRPALRLQSDGRLALLGHAGSDGAFATITNRYRRPLERHCAGLVGKQRAQAVVASTYGQARALFGDDDRSREPGPWLYWMAHNMAIADLKRGAPANGSGPADGNGVIAANGASDAAPTSSSENGGAAGGALAALTFSEGARLFLTDSDTKKMTHGTRVRLRNGVGALVPKALLSYSGPARTNGSGGTTKTPSATATAGRPRRLRPAIVIFGLCGLAAAGAFMLDRSDNIDPKNASEFGALSGQPGALGDTPGTPPTGGQPGADLPGLLGGLSDGANGAAPPATDSGSATDSTTVPPTAGTTPPASTTGQSRGIAGLLSLFGVEGADSAAARSANPLGLVLGLLGILPDTPASTTPKPAKAPKPAKPPKLPGSTGSTPVTPTPTPTPTPSPAPAKPPKPKLPPLGLAGPTISYTAAKNQSNDVTVAKSGKKFTITDRGVKGSIPVSSGCRLSKASGPSKTEVCATKGVDRFEFRLGNRDDTLNLRVVKPASIFGEAGDDVLTGGRRSDSIDGGRGADRIDGRKGNDTLTGGKGEDDLAGGKGNDTITGGPNDDHIVGGKGNDTLQSDAGDDRIDARDGEADNITCGSGNDTVTADAVGIDTVASDCETVIRS